MKLIVKPCWMNVKIPFGGVHAIKCCRKCGCVEGAQAGNMGSWRVGPPHGIKQPQRFALRFDYPELGILSKRLFATHPIINFEHRATTKQRVIANQRSLARTKRRGETCITMTDD